MFMSYKFKGWDWTELAECWNLGVDTEKDDEKIIKEKIINHIYNNLDDKGNFKNKQIREDIHNFLRALMKINMDFDNPVYEGMLKIQHDATLARWVTNNLEMMWT